MRLPMAKAAEKRNRTETLPLDKTGTAASTDPAIKSLIDELIVPYMVEEFLRLYGPTAVAKSDAKNNESGPNSELNSTP